MKNMILVFMLMASTSVFANTFTVSNSGSSDYIINAQNDPTLELVRGETYTFEVAAPGHPFWINSVQGTGTGNAYNNGVTGNGTANGTITFVVASDAPDVLYYNCEIHGPMTGQINLSNPPPATRYVSESGSTPAPPYISWASAAASIQEAVDVSFPGDMVVVSNGVYAVGGRTFGGGSLTNRVVIDKAITVTSVNGPDVTAILGAYDPATTNGATAVRGVYLGTNAVLSGFTVTNGATGDVSSDPTDRVGGGVYAEISSIVSNCVISANRAYWGGGGVYGGTVRRSVISGNQVEFGSGGLLNANADNCLITANSTRGTELYSASAVGSGTFLIWPGPFPASNTLRNCTIVLNDGANVVTDNNESSKLDVRNCVIWDNPNSTTIRIAGNANFQYSNYNGDLYRATIGGTTNNPEFVDSMAGNYQLRGISPGLDAGENSVVVGGTDLLGADRIFNGTVDMGAYEAVNSDSDSLTDAEEVSKFFTNPLLADSDEDGLDDDEEVYITLTDPLLGDTDDDGFGDKFEVDNGYSPTNNQHQVLVDYVAANGSDFGLYTTNAFQALSPGSLYLDRGSNDLFKVTVALQRSSNLVDFIPFPMTSTQAVINAEGELEFEFPQIGDEEFYRLQSK